MKLVAGEESKGLFIEDNFFTDKEFVKVREWANNNIRSGIGCQNKMGKGGTQMDYSDEKIYNLTSVATEKQCVRGYKTTVRNIINKVYNKLKPFNIECLKSATPTYEQQWGGEVPPFNAGNITKLKNKHIFFDMHSTDHKVGDYNLDWHKDPAISLTFLIYLHDEWEENWGGDFMWIDYQKLKGATTIEQLKQYQDKDGMIQLTESEGDSVGGVIECKPNRIVVDTMNINHRVSNINTKSQRLTLHGWAW